VTPSKAAAARATAELLHKLALQPPSQQSMSGGGRLRTTPVRVPDIHRDGKAPRRSGIGSRGQVSEGMGGADFESLGATGKVRASDSRGGKPARSPEGKAPWNYWSARKAG
jgi:hypothetical protein